MTRYKLPEQIDNVDNSKPLIDDTVIKGNFKIVDTIDQRNSIPILKRQIGCLVSINNNIKQYIGATTNDIDWENELNWKSINNLDFTDYLNKTDEESTIYGVVNIQDPNNEAPNSNWLHTIKDYAGNIIMGIDRYGRYRDWETDRKSTRLNSSHSAKSRMPSSA